MSLWLYVEGKERFFVRTGFAGVRPLIYAVYAIGMTGELPYVPGQVYKTITHDQYEWLCNHLNCDVSYLTSAWPEHVCDLECRTHREHYRLFDSCDPVISDTWEDRQV
jgi:hypothetical protein